MKAAVALLLSLLLAACGGGDPEDDEPAPCKTSTSALTGKTSVAEVCR